jgi:hypothetical protein
LKQDGAADVVVLVACDWWINGILGACGFRSVGILPRLGKHMKGRVVNICRVAPVSLVERDILWTWLPVVEGVRDGEIKKWRKMRETEGYQRRKCKPTSSETEAVKE